MSFLGITPSLAASSSILPPPQDPMEGEEKKLLDASMLEEFDINTPEGGKKKKTTQEIILDLFFSNQEFMDFSKHAISKSLEKSTPDMNEQILDELASSGMLAAINKRYAAKEKCERSIQKDLKEASEFPGHAARVKAMMKAEEIFASGVSEFDTQEFSGENEGQEYIAHQKSKSEISVYSVGKVLQSGGSATVSKVMDVATGKFSALKKSKYGTNLKDPSRNIFVKNFTKGAELSGMLNPTTLLISEKLIGYLLPLYEVDMITALSNPPYASSLSHQDKQRFVRQVIDQQFYLWDRGWLNIDLKPENTMLMFPEREKKEAAASKTSVKLIDLDDSMNFSYLKEHNQVDLVKIQRIMDEIRSSHYPTGGGTGTYTSVEDLNKLIALRSEMDSLPEQFDESVSKENIEKTLNFLNRYRETVERRVIFTLGATCFVLLSGTYPYDKQNLFLGPTSLGEFASPEPSRTCLYDNYLRANGYSERVIAFLRKMMHPDPAARPSRREVEDAFNGFKFLSDEELDKLGSTVKRNLQKEVAMAAEAVNYPPLEEVDAQIKKLSMESEEQEEGWSFPMDMSLENQAELEHLNKVRKFLERFAALQKANREITDFNPYKANSKTS